MKQNYTNSRRLSQEDFDLVVKKISMLEDQAELEKIGLSGYQIIQNAKEIYLASIKAEIEDCDKNNCRGNYIKSLIDYGYIAKGEWEQSGQMALRLFEDALKIDRKLPIVHYRIGHILFKQGKYAEAVASFYNAISLMSHYTNKNHGLNEIQQLNAKKLMSYCALSIFEGVKDDSLKSDMYPELNKEIKQYLSRQKEGINDKLITVRRIKDQGIEELSLNDYHDYLEKIEVQSVIVINGYDHIKSIGFRNDSVSLSEKQYKLILDTIDEDYDDPLNYINSSEPKRNSFNQSLVRIRNKFTDIGIGEDLIKLKKIENYDFRAEIITDLEILIFRRIED